MEKERVYVEGRLMILLVWTPTFTPEVETPIAPVWLVLPQLPWHCYNMVFVSKLLEPVGRVLFIDAASVQKTRGSVVKVKIEIDFTKPRPPHIWLGFPFEEGDVYGEGGWQELQFEDVPEYCHFCKHQGHSQNNCKAKIRDDDYQNKKKEQDEKEIEPAKSGRSEIQMINHNGPQAEAIQSSHTVKNLALQQNVQEKKNLGKETPKVVKLITGKPPLPNRMYVPKKSADNISATNKDSMQTVILGCKGNGDGVKNRLGEINQTINFTNSFEALNKLANSEIDVVTEKLPNSNTAPIAPLIDSATGVGNFDTSNAYADIARVPKEVAVRSRVLSNEFTVGNSTGTENVQPGEVGYAGHVPVVPEKQGKKNVTETPAIARTTVQVHNLGATSFPEITVIDAVSHDVAQVLNAVKGTNIAGLTESGVGIDATTGHAAALDGGTSRACTAADATGNGNVTRDVVPGIHGGKNACAQKENNVLSTVTAARCEDQNALHVHFPEAQNVQNSKAHSFYDLTEKINVNDAVPIAAVSTSEILYDHARQGELLQNTVMLVHKAFTGNSVPHRTGDVNGAPPIVATEEIDAEKQMHFGAVQNEIADVGVPDKQVEDKENKAVTSLTETLFLQENKAVTALTQEDIILDAVHQLSQLPQVAAKSVPIAALVPGNSTAKNVPSDVESTKAWVMRSFGTPDNIPSTALNQQLLPSRAICDEKHATPATNSAKNNCRAVQKTKKKTRQNTDASTDEGNKGEVIQHVQQQTEEEIRKAKIRAWQDAILAKSYAEIPVIESNIEPLNVQENKATNSVPSQDSFDPSNAITMGRDNDDIENDRALTAYVSPAHSGNTLIPTATLEVMCKQASKVMKEVGRGFFPVTPQDRIDTETQEAPTYYLGDLFEESQKDQRKLSKEVKSKWNLDAPLFIPNALRQQETQVPVESVDSQDASAHVFPTGPSDEVLLQRMDLHDIRGLLHRQNSQPHDLPQKFSSPHPGIMEDGSEYEDEDEDSTAYNKMAEARYAGLSPRFEQACKPKLIKKKRRPLEPKKKEAAPKKPKRVQPTRSSKSRSSRRK